ncbi:MAG: hypothetical protein E6F99_00420 [Actinobacteria bacterium]|nr:MAG: hypothetical protein E6F99_00420 [Actinomycetota bacterium]
MEIRILGPLEVVDGQGSSAKLGGRKQRIVLAALALRAGATVSADRLVDLVWGDRPPTQPEATLQVYLSNLRKLFSNGAARVVRRAPGYRLELGPWVLDRDRFGALVDEGREAQRRGDLVDALDRFETANGLWRGTLAADLSDEPFVRAAAVEADERRREVLGLTYGTLLALGRHGEAVAALEGLCAEDPGQERMWELLMLALYRSGRAAEALRTFHRAREALAEFGLDPTPALVSMQSRILAHDPALGAAPAAPPPSTPSLLGRDALVGRVAGVIEKLTGVRYASTQTWMILRQRLGWTRQRPARRAAERDDAAIEAWVKRDWPRIKRGPVGEAPGSSSRTNPGSPSSRR